MYPFDIELKVRITRTPSGTVYLDTNDEPFDSYESLAEAYRVVVELLKNKVRLATLGEGG